MSRKTLIILLIISIGINIGLIGTILYKRSIVREGEVTGYPDLSKWISRNVEITPEQEEKLGEIFLEKEQVLDDLRSELAEKRMELSLLLRGEEPDLPAIDEKVMEISTLQEEMQQEIIKQILKIREVLGPEQCNAFDDHMGRGLCPGSKGKRKRYGW